MSDRFEAVVKTAVVEGEGVVEVEIVSGSIARPQTSCRIKLEMRVERARLYPAGAKVMVTLESELEGELPAGQVPASDAAVPGV
jgi:hypothetical protein